MCHFRCRFHERYRLHRRRIAPQNRPAAPSGRYPLCYGARLAAAAKVLESYELTELIGQEKHLQHTAGGSKNLPVAKRSTVENGAAAQNCLLHSYVVIGGGVLEAPGIRDTMDVDLVVNKNHDKFKTKAGKNIFRTTVSGCCPTRATK